MVSLRHKSRLVNSDTDHIAFILVIFLSCAIWEHETFLLQIAHIFLFLLKCIAAFALTFLIFKLGRKLRTKRSSTYSMNQIDIMRGIDFEYCVAGLLVSQDYSKI